jgi:tetratricopeptide (TPR) repeat protein
VEIKDIITVSLSVLAFLLSGSATIISLIRSKYEKQRAIKKEITETLGRIVSTALDSAKIYRETAQSDPNYFQAVSSILNQQNTFLLNQATYLAEQVPTLMTAVEYNTIASATASAGDLIAADRYYRKAVDASPNAYFRALAMRSYANFLFSQHRFDEARILFTRSVGLVTGTGDFVHFTNGFTYQMWGWNELNQAHSQQHAEACFEIAASEFSAIDNETVRRDALNRLQLARAGDPAAHPVNRPAFQPKQNAA